MNRRTGVIDVDPDELGFSIAHAVMGAARDHEFWIVYKTAHGIFADRMMTKRFKNMQMIAVVQYIGDNIVDVIYTSDKRVERLYV